MAILARAANRQRQSAPYHVGGREWRVQTERPGASSCAVGKTKKQTSHELREAQPSTAVLL